VSEEYIRDLWKIVVEGREVTHAASASGRARGAVSTAFESSCGSHQSITVSALHDAICSSHLAWRMPVYNVTSLQYKIHCI